MDFYFNLPQQNDFTMMELKLQIFLFLLDCRHIDVRIRSAYIIIVVDTHFLMLHLVMGIERRRLVDNIT
jgi:hypothetical protein